jgi:hypothetical protein
MNPFTKMRDRTDQELKATISAALDECDRIPNMGDDFFWKICSGIDAYFEQRRRKDKALAYGQTFETPADPSSPAWDSEA